MGGPQDSYKEQDAQQRSLTFLKGVPSDVWKDVIMERNRGGTGLDALTNYANINGINIKDFKENLLPVIELTCNIWDRILQEYKALKDKPGTPLALKDFVEKAYMKYYSEEYSPQVSKAVSSLLRDYQADNPVVKKPVAPKSENTVTVAGYNIRFAKDNEGVQTAVVSGVGGIEMSKSRSPLDYANELKEYGVPDAAAFAIGEELHARATRVASK